MSGTILFCFCICCSEGSPTPPPSGMEFSQLFLNKSRLFVLRIQIRTTSLAQMQSPSRERHSHGGHRHVVSLPTLRRPGCWRRETSHFPCLKSYMRTQPPTDKTSLSGESQGWMLLRAQRECSELHLLILIENMLKGRKKIKPKTSPSNSTVNPRE